MERKIFTVWSYLLTFALGTLSSHIISEPKANAARASQYKVVWLSTRNRRLDRCRCYRHSGAKSRSPGVSGSQKGMGDCLTAFDAPASFCSSNFAVFHRAKYSMFEEFVSRSRPFDGWVFSEVTLFLNSRCSLIATLVSKNASRLTVTVMNMLLSEGR